MSSDYAHKLKLIRKAEGLTQRAFSELVGVSLGSVKNYETGQVEAGLRTIEAVVNNAKFKKYTMWLMTGDVAPEIGQIAPALSPDGHGKISSNQKGHKAG